MRDVLVFPHLQKLLDVPRAKLDKVVIISVVGKSAFKTGVKVNSIGKALNRNNKEEETSIECWYDQEKQIIYLHLNSYWDSDYLIKHYDELKKKSEDERMCNDFLAINDEIKSNFARNLLFLLYVSHIIVLSHPSSTFDTNYIQIFKAIDNLSQKIFESITEKLKTIKDLSPEWVTNGRPCTPRVIFYFERSPKNIKNLQKLEQNLEDKIYYVLKKMRIINITGVSLFAIPLNETFAYINKDDVQDKLGNAVRALIKDCQPGGGGMQIEAPYSSEPPENSFLKFLQVHINQAKNKGFEDTISSNRHQQIHVHFELPTIKNWISASLVLHNLIVKPKLVSNLCTDTLFSEQRCTKVLPLALAKYQEGLAQHYSRSEHEARLNSALAFFRAQARGPLYYQYVEQLEVECEELWENGRQQCEVASMTGNPCKLPKHSSDQEHMSGFIYKALCDCGRKIGQRDDPYSTKQANYLFYHLLSKECQCSKLERIHFPVFEPSIKEYKAATLDSEDILSVISNPSEEYNEENDRVLVRQPSTTEYLPGMLTLSSPPGLLPVYCSWSLVCLGASSLYSHNLGLSESYHPGFLSSTNYLLPWDVTVYSKAKSITYSSISKFPARGRRGRQPSSQPQFTVKVFIGVEYECSSGHRFMLAAPDKVLKATPGSLVKDTGQKIADSDMPLYYPCACRAGKYAQLMRLHVVTPKAPVYCTLNPKIQPATDGPVFIPTNQGVTKLSQSAYWVMRLPYVYVADKDHYLQNPSAKLLQGVFGVTEID